MFKALTLTIALVSSVSAKISTGSCANPSLVENYDVNRYAGIWFQIAKDLSSPFENGNCAQSRYGLNPNGSVSV